MESSGYGGGHLSSPALVVFSQAAAGGLSEALRIQRPFHSQIPDAKDLHHLSLVGSYGAHLLHGFPPHFLHSSIGSADRGQFGTNGAFVKPFPSSLPLPSAFAPPKCISGLSGMDQSMMFGGANEFRNSESSSPACNSLSPPVKEESLEGHTSEDGDRDRICTPERSPETPGFRPPKTSSSGIAEPLNLRLDSAAASAAAPGPLHPLYRFPYTAFPKRYLQQGIGLPPNKSKLSLSGQQSNLSQSSISSSNSSSSHSAPNSCPVCGIQLSSNELDTHFLTELDRLYKLTTPAERQRLRASLSSMGGPNSHQNGHPELGLHLSSGGPGSRWETFNRIRANRQNRLRAKTRKRKGDSESDYPSPTGIGQCQSCPVCHGRLQRTSEEISQHIEDCIKKSGQNFSMLNHPNLTQSLNSNNANSANSSSNSSNNNQDEDETVDVESYGDDASVNSGTSQNLANHPLNPMANCHPSSSLSLKLIEHQTIPSISNPNHPHHQIHNSLHHLHHPGHNHLMNHHHNHHHHPYNGHPLHHMSLAQNPHLSNQPQQTTPLSLSMNSEPTNSPSTASDEVTSISSWDKKHKNPSQFNGPTTTLPSPIVSRVTPTSTNHKMDVDYEDRSRTEIPSVTTSTTTTTTTTSVRIAARSTSRGGSSENEEDVVVDTIEDDEDMEDKNNNNIKSKGDAQMKSRILDEEKLDRKSTEEATSSVEIDSATDPVTTPISKSSKHVNGTTPDSYVSTSESSEPTSRAQVLEELRARIRELEGSPFKSRSNQEEEHYRCFICKEPYRSPVISTICWHVHCDDCWISISDSKKSCPQCTIVTTTNDFRKIQV